MTKPRIKKAVDPSPAATRARKLDALHAKQARQRAKIAKTPTKKTRAQVLADRSAIDARLAWRLSGHETTVFVLQEGDCLSLPYGSSSGRTYGGPAIVHVSEHVSGAVDVHEYDIDDPQFWGWVARMMRDGVIANGVATLTTPTDVTVDDHPVPTKLTINTTRGARRRATMLVKQLNTSDNPGEQGEIAAELDGLAEDFDLDGRWPLGDPGHRMRKPYMDAMREECGPGTENNP